jgi:GINS complex subunit 2
MPPPWLYEESLREILELETKHFSDSFAPAPSHPPTRQTDAQGHPFETSDPFLASCTANAAAHALPYHWFEVSEMLLDAAADDMGDHGTQDRVRQLLRDLREVRLAKMRRGVEALNGEGDGVRLDGIGAMEVSESRGFITGVMDGLRRIGASREQARREREEEERENGRYNADDDEDEDML